MVILLAGANGFLGRALSYALAAGGHVILGTTRDPTSAHRGSVVARWLKADYTRDHSAEDWTPRLAGVDLAINAVGIFRESLGQTFHAIHVAAPRALFEACAKSGVRVVQISALGADDGVTSAYHASKRAADEFLLGICPTAAVLQPSLVYGPGGGSATLFNLLASMPLLPLPGKGTQRLQPIHVEDFATAVARVIDAAQCQGVRVPLVGPKPVTLRGYLAALREGLGLGKPTFIPIPWRAMQLLARIAQLLPRSLLTLESLSMLERGNTADAMQTRRLLGREPRAVTAFISPAESGQARLDATLSWLLPVLRIAIATVWIVSGIVSLGVYPVEESYQLLARVGITGSIAPFVLYGAALLDLVFGLASLLLPRRRLLWLAQTAVILGYTCVITFALPEYWLHPFGPIVKNLPMLAALWTLYELERR